MESAAPVALGPLAPSPRRLEPLHQISCLQPIGLWRPQHYCPLPLWAVQLQPGLPPQSTRTPVTGSHLPLLAVPATVAVLFC